MNISEMTVEEFREYQMERLDGMVKYWNKLVESENYDGSKKLNIEEWDEEFESYSTFVFGNEAEYL